MEFLSFSMNTMISTWPYWQHQKRSKQKEIKPLPFLFFSSVFFTSFCSFSSFPLFLLFLRFPLTNSILSLFLSRHFIFFTTYWMRISNVWDKHCFFITDEITLFLFHVLQGVMAFNQADIQGLNTILTAVVDYRGHRLVAQSIIPGILHREQATQVRFPTHPLCTITTPLCVYGLFCLYFRPLSSFFKKMFWMYFWM